MTPISEMSNEQLMAKVFERVGMWIGYDGTGQAYVATHNDDRIAGPNSSLAITTYYALCYMATHALKDTKAKEER